LGSSSLRTSTVDREHRQHAECELVFRDLEDQALAHSHFGRFAADCDWTMITSLAHNLRRCAGRLWFEDPTARTARTILRWLLALPPRLTPTARRLTLHLCGSLALAARRTRIRAPPAAV
jgi:hypothetical protein